ncbi:MAG TPA: ABC transporter ATP-binding protein [Arachnia sp.]|nr:ABC transporter ATP-binding protein [Arachnia sp.]HMT87032.1 ABC transporter ATP-binding protein [Arachnia sp.]
MIRTLLSLLPLTSRPQAFTHATLTALSVIARAVSAVFLVPIVAALFGPSPSQAWPWVGALAAVIAAGWVFDWASARIGYELGFGLLDTGQRAVSERLARTRLTWFDAEHLATARLGIAATGPDLVGIVVYLVTPVLSALLLPIAIALALFPVAPPLALAALAGVPVLWGAYLAAGAVGRAADRTAASAHSTFTERLLEFARTQHALRAARRVDPERSQVGAALSRQHGATMRLLTMQVPGQLLFSVASQVVLFGLAATTAWLATTGRIGAPEAVALIVVIIRYLEPFTVLAELSGGVEAASGVLRRLRTVLAAPLVPVGDDGRSPEGPVAIEFRDVSFSYGDDSPRVLDRFTLALEPGRTTAIVGPSGSGKSTVLALLAGLHTPTSGAILVDGRDVASLDAEARRRLVSMVFQEPYLFDGTIRHNVLTGLPDASDESLARTAELARVEPIVNRLPDSWATRVGEGGSTLSGGERQRVSIARALLKPAPLLLVDEATSALDTENERAIATALTADPTARTRVIVAHRLASISAADRVVFLEDGRIVDDGGVDELLAAGGRFAEFWRHQDAASGWRLGAV